MSSYFPDPNKISPTAKLVAYWRQFSDVPYAREVSELIQARQVSEQILNQPISVENMGWLAPMIEARYKSLGAAVKRAGVKQVLELASGVALRGLAMSADSELIYVESDLQPMSEEKKRLVQKMRIHQEIPLRNNLFYESADALCLEELKEAARHFSKEKPIAVIHEGLMPYLSLEEKEGLARNIHALLKSFGGWWITPDFTTRKELEKWNRNEELQSMVQSVGQLTSRSFKDSAFEDDQQVEEFCSRMGFEVSVSPQVDGSYRLTSADRLQISEDLHAEYLSQLKLWTLTAKT
jgi:O-methyltransferase involved in polyketide biosynthesis